MYKNIFKNKKAVVFDLDDTLVETFPIWNAALQSVCDDIGLIWPGYEQFVGQRLEVIWPEVIGLQDQMEIKISVMELVEKSEQKFLQLLSDMSVEERAGFWEFAYEMKEEKKLKLALVSNSPRKIVDSVLSSIGIEQTFDAVVCGDEVKKPKPDPEMYKKATKLLDVRTKDIVAFEDSPTGAKSAVSAGCTVIVVYNGTFFESEYPKQVSTMVGSFYDMVGKTDLTYRDVLERTTELIKKEESEQS